MRIIAALIIIVVMTGLIFFSMHTMRVMRSERLVDEHKATVAVSSKLDFYLEQANYLQYDQQGLPVQQIAAELVEHYENGNRFKLIKPIFTLFSPQEEPWVITAGRADSWQGRDVVDLQQQVEITRARGPFNSQIKVDTEQLRIYLAQRKATTKRAVSFLEDANLMRGVGATIDFKEGLIKLASEVRIWYKLGF